ncbi:MAG: chromate efflux transporter [Pseudomonadota bacterium]
MTTPSFSETWPVYLRIGLLSFGGPAGQIALMQDEITDRRGWVSSEAFQRGLSVAMILPGPEAQQLATWLGWRLHGLKGALAAGLAFILPGAVLMIALAWIAAAYGDTPLISALFYGIQPAVLVIVAKALWGLAGRSLKTPMAWGLAGAAFLGIWALGLPFPLIIALAALVGLLLPGEVSPGTPVGKVGLSPALWALSLGLALILAVVAVVEVITQDAVFREVATLFTTAAFVSFGGAYALLPYVADRAVETYGWLSAEQMLNGLALAESTPGPLILVNVYAGFFAGWPSGGWAGVATAALACFYTFAPSFMLILAAAPYVDALQSVPRVRKALAGVSAAVVGVVLNLGVYLGEAALFPMGLAAPDFGKIALLVAFALLAWLRPIPMIWLVALGAACGIFLWLTGLV